MAAVFEITTYMGQMEADEIISVSLENWTRVLNEKQSDEPASCGECCVLRNHISNREILHLLKVVVERVLASKKSVDFLYCCDSDTVRRFMMLEIVPVGSETVEIRRRTLVKDQREYMPSSDEAVMSPGELLRMCSWCKKLHTDSWVEVDDAIRQFRLLEYKNVPLISHTICEDCKDTVLGSSRNQSRQAS